MVKKRGLPMLGELVICKIIKINPNSAFAVLEEYGIEGMIHISEVSSGWVRDIRHHVKMDQTGVAKVIRIDEQTDNISLSLKRVLPKQEIDKMKEYRMSQRAEKMLEMTAKKMDKNLDQAYEEVGFILQENFGSLYEGFKAALKGAEVLRKRNVPEKWIEPIREMAEKNIEMKEFKFSARLTLKSYKPDGINIIKDVLKEVEKSKLSVSYISAPEYLVRFKTKDAKKGEKDLKEKMEKIIAMAKKSGVEAGIDFKNR